MERGKWIIHDQRELVVNAGSNWYEFPKEINSYVLMVFWPNSQKPIGLKTQFSGLFFFFFFFANEESANCSTNHDIYFMKTCLERQLFRDNYFFFINFFSEHHVTSTLHTYNTNESTLCGILAFSFLDIDEYWYLYLIIAEWDEK